VSTRRGRPPYPDLLTPAEWRIVDAVRHGMPGRRIARRRRVSEDAVKFHVANALRKLNLSSRAELRFWPGVPAGGALGTRPENGYGDETMQQQLRLGPLGQIARHVTDVAHAVEWYGSVLGLEHLYTFGDLAFFDCGGVRLFLSTDGGDDAGRRPAAEPSVLYFRVPDIHAAYKQLSDRGVTFRGAPHLIHKHESGVEEWMAFFDDPDGHPLAIMTQVGT
jgi:DNA-binding CsgD family transcriptional regulator/catechol 2,3-dioxygenase-like lactoylglutathione lyase family enzyme